MLLFSHSVMSLCNPMDCSTPGFPLFRYFPEFVQLMSIEPMMPSNHHICPPLLHQPLIFPSIRVFSNESALCIRWTKYWNFSFSSSPSIKHSELVSLRLTGLMTNVPLVKAMVFPIFMYRCESWAIKKAECQRLDAFVWCWRRLLRVPWTARSNQSILKEISPGYSLKGLMLKLKLQYFGPLMWRTDSLEKTLMLGKIESRRRRGR